MLLYCLSSSVNLFVRFILFRLVSIAVCPMYAGTVPTLEKYYDTAKKEISLPLMQPVTPVTLPKMVFHFVVDFIRIRVFVYTGLSSYVSL